MNTRMKHTFTLIKGKKGGCSRVVCHNFSTPLLCSFPHLPFKIILVLSKVTIIAVDEFDLYSCVSNDDGRLASGHSVADFTQPNLLSEALNTILKTILRGFPRGLLFVLWFVFL